MAGEEFVKARGHWQGMLSIARFNWPLYAAASMVIAIAIFGVCLFAVFWIQLIWVAVLGGALWFLIGSLGVSHLIYDQSDLYRWRWLEPILAETASGTAILCHSGFDEISEALRSRFPGWTWKVLDHFDGERMTEASIHRARQLYPPREGTLAASYDRWPVDSGSADAVLGILAIHEFRSETERTDWFREARRCLQENGRVIVAEHLRDFPNFLAFGPGFVHFHSRNSWQRCWNAAGLSLREEFRVTPWIAVFVLSHD